MQGRSMGQSAGTTALGLLVLRAVVGLVFFMHGWQKFFDTELSNVEAFFDSEGIILPELMAPLVATLELIGGAALILGVATRLVALGFVIDMLVALLTVHRPNGFFASDGGYELVLLLGSASLALVVTGAGALSVDAMLGVERRARERILPVGSQRRAYG